MICHECAQPAVGQCRHCRIGYCLRHGGGNGLCWPCRVRVEVRWAKVQSAIVPLVLTPVLVLIAPKILWALTGKALSVGEHINVLCIGGAVLTPLATYAASAWAGRRALARTEARRDAVVKSAGAEGLLARRAGSLAWRLAIVVLMAWAGWWAIDRLSEDRQTRMREDAQVRAWCHMLVNAETVRAVKPILNGHLRPEVDPNHLNGWRSTFGEEARAVATIIELALTQEGIADLDAQYGDHVGLSPYLAWSSGKALPMGYATLRDEYFIGELGLEARDILVLDELWRTYTTGRGNLREALASD